MKGYQYILNLLGNDLRGGYCTAKEYASLNKKIIYNSKNNTREWQILIDKIHSSFPGNTYPPLGWLTKTLKRSIEPYGVPGKRLFKKRQKQNVSYTGPTRKSQPTYEVKKPSSEKSGGYGFTESISHHKAKSPEKPVAQVKPPPIIKTIIKKEETVKYYFSFADPKGFFWDDKKTEKETSSSVFVLQLIKKGKTMGKYSMLTNKNKIIKNALLNPKAFLNPVCNIVQTDGSQKIMVVKEGMLEKKQNKWVPVTGKELQIKMT